MTQHEKDLQRAKEYIAKSIPELIGDDLTVLDMHGNESKSVLYEILVNHINHLEAAGVIKYIARREEDNPIISTQKECRNCGYEVDNIDVICKTCHVFL